jgi:integrase
MRCTNSVQVTNRQPKRANGQGTIYVIGRRSDGRPNKFRAEIFDINHVRRTKVSRNLKDAEDWLAQQKSARDKGEITYAVSPKLTVGEFLIQWIENRKPQLKFNTYKSYKASIHTRINPYIGNLNAAKLSPIAVEQLISTLIQAGYKAGSINGAYRTLRAAYKHAVKVQLLPSNPIARVSEPKLASISPKPIPKMDWEKIYFEASKDPYMHARIEIGGVCGNRSGEVRGFLWSDLDVENGILWVERQVLEAPGVGLYFDLPKTNDRRPVYLSTEQVEILLRHKRYQSLSKAHWKEDLDLIFPNSVGKMMDSKLDRKKFNSLCAKAGVPNYQITRMRKTAFTNIAKLTDLKTAMDYSGHKQSSTLIKSYIFSTPESVQRLLKGIDDSRPESFALSTLENKYIDGFIENQ